jgi:hypothetical protein
MGLLTRVVIVLFLLGMLVACGSQAVAAWGVPRDDRDGYRLLDAAVAVVGTLGAVWLVRPVRSRASGAGSREAVAVDQPGESAAADAVGPV